MNADLWVDPRVRQVAASGMESYLTAHGWKRVQHPRKQLMVFEGPLDDDGEPLILAIPSSERFKDFTGRIVRVIESLSIVEGRHPVEILNDILKENPPSAPPVAQDGVNAPVSTG
jgi:hypothetical protein